MSDKIYIWEIGSGNIGHGSMTLHDGTHISWWPKDEKSKSSATIDMEPVEAVTVSSYSGDVALENKDADFVFEIESGKLNIADIKDWWTKFRDNSMYHLIHCNCCTVIFEALVKGGSETFVTVKLPIIATPDSLKEYALALQEGTNEEEL